MQTATLTTEPFSCPSCITKIEKTLAKVKGVQSAKVMFHSSKVKVEFDETAVEPETLSSTVSKLGYPVLTLAVS